MRALLSNYPLISALLAILIAQALKIPLYYIEKRRWDWRQMFTTGGMPSSHSAGVSSLALALGLCNGFDTPLFAVAAILGMIVMYDAMGIRRHAGETAMALNQLEADFDKHIEESYRGKTQQYFRKKQKKLKEMLGHQPIEVVVGCMLGLFLAIVVFYSIWM